MNHALLDQIVNAVLYEGYILYPYRPSVKNQKRWTFGVLYPRSHSLAHGSGDAWSMRTECLLRGGETATLNVHVRFLHLLARQVGEPEKAMNDLAEGDEPAFRPVAQLRVGERLLQTWQEAVEREVTLDGLELAGLLDQARRQHFTFPASRSIETVRDPAGPIEAILVRHQESVSGLVEVSADPVGAGLFKLVVRVENHAVLDCLNQARREDSVLRCLASTHTILNVRDAAFLSAIDPPDEYRPQAALCQNEGTWPVLVGDAGDTDTILSSPITLYDYPEIAAESPSNFYDGTEIDEMLVLRILTLTDDEKEAAAAVDERARALLARTSALGDLQVLGLHGKLRGMRFVSAENRDG
jgi:hydrogenase maturation protease